MSDKVKIFYSYSHKDRTLRDELGKHLSTSRDLGLLEDWHDGQIVPGEAWDDDIKNKLVTADFVLLLISSDFLFSDYIRSVELDSALRRQQAQEAVVIPIMLRTCDTTGAPFSRLQGLPAGMKPVDTWPNQDEAWTDVAKGIRKAIEKFHKSRSSAAAPAPATLEAAPLPAAPVVSPALEPAPSAPPAPPPTQEPAPSATQEKNRVLAAASTSAFVGLRQLMTNARVKQFVAAEQPGLEAASGALQTLVDYKNVHDLLHDLQFKCYNFLLQESRKPEENLDWPVLVAPEKDLRALTLALEQAARQDALADEDFTWLEELSAAQKALTTACEELSPDPLKKARELIWPILGMRPTIFDTKLCAAARTLPLDDLQSALAGIRAKLTARALGSDGGAKFVAGLEALPELSTSLQTLTTEHTKWQVIATNLWRIDALIEEDFEELPNSWAKLEERLQRICAGKNAPWSASILEAVARLTELLGTPKPETPKEARRWETRVRQSYRSCSSEAGTRFYQVDLSLKRLCDQLRELETALANVLKDLP